uniref:Uncharacterized protein n=1 Tax=Panagrellus redivivus TaxID=6233 RepID=A0A7E4ZSK8_PANRE
MTRKMMMIAGGGAGCDVPVRIAKGNGGRFMEVIGLMDFLDWVLDLDGLDKCTTPCELVPRKTRPVADRSQNRIAVIVSWLLGGINSKRQLSSNLEAVVAIKLVPFASTKAIRKTDVNKLRDNQHPLPVDFDL